MAFQQAGRNGGGRSSALNDIIINQVKLNNKMKKKHERLVKLKKLECQAYG